MKIHLKIGYFKIFVADNQIPRHQLLIQEHFQPGFYLITVVMSDNQFQKSCYLTEQFIHQIQKLFRYFISVGKQLIVRIQIQLATMIAKNTRRQALKNKLKKDLEGSHNLKKMDIEQENQTQPIIKNHIQTQRHFGKDITNGVLCAQNVEHKDSFNPPKPDTQTVSQFFENSSMIVEEFFVHQKKSEVAIYQDSISAHLQSIQKLTEPFSNYFSWQSQIDEHMRQILISWLMDLHERFKLKEETLFKSITIMDRYLSLEPIKRSRLQLLGITAIYISCKYQEVLLQDVRRFISVCGNAYSVQQLLEMQSKILVSMNFNLVTTSSLRVMQLRCEILSISEDIRLFSEHLLEMCLFQFSMCKYAPSIMSLASIYLSAKILHEKALSANYLLKAFPIQQEIFRLCLKDMFQIFKTKNSTKFAILRRKYANKGLYDQ